MLAQVGHKLKTFLPLPPEDHDCKVVMTATPCLVVCVDYAVESTYFMIEWARWLNTLTKGEKWRIEELR